MIIAVEKVSVVVGVGFHFNPFSADKTARNEASSIGKYLRNGSHRAGWRGQSRRGFCVHSIISITALRDGVDGLQSGPTNQGRVALCLSLKRFLHEVEQQKNLPGRKNFLFFLLLLSLAWPFLVFCAEKSGRMENHKTIKVGQFLSLLVT